MPPQHYPDGWRLAGTQQQPTPQWTPPAAVPQQPAYLQQTYPQQTYPAAQGYQQQTPHQPPPATQPAHQPPPAPKPPQKPKRSHKKLAALALLILGLFVACAVTAHDTTPSVPTAPKWKTGATTAASAQPPAAATVDGGKSPVDAPAAVVQPARKITAREWQLVAKNPASHTGERLIVYGQVTQFDAATGTEGFRANVDGVQHKVSYGYADYDTNTILDGDPSLLQNVVEKDLFRAEVTVEGAKSYDTALGGSTTAPQLTVTKIDVIGHAG